MPPKINKAESASDPSLSRDTLGLARLGQPLESQHRGVWPMRVLNPKANRRSKSQVLSCSGRPEFLMGYLFFVGCFVCLLARQDLPMQPRLAFILLPQISHF